MATANNKSGWAAFGQWTLDLFEMVLNRTRVNVLVVAWITYLLIKDFGDKLIELLQGGEATGMTGAVITAAQGAGVPTDAIITVLTALISVGIGGLIAAMMRMFESPSVPADAHERIIDRLMEKTAELVMAAHNQAMLDRAVEPKE